ncbi:caspase domain-containing protein [Streptomyces sp. NBC_00829]|uniref:caspase family protein n=1 Tax=Streptomyces sp. NBC_00829 TaxID=2903679 RepID=UPI003863069F|nr:caspase family protein [Streptomyces sp. NBC_00829]
MPTGLSLHVGLNSVDPAKYGGWDGQLVACENDANDMARLAREAGFNDSTLLTGDGTVENITAELRRASRLLSDGDIVLFTYSGHGGRMPNINGSDTEADEMDETLVFYDREFLDDELYREFGRFADGVRILTFLDCCHSGTAIEEPSGESDVAPRLMPEFKQREIFERDKEFFQSLQQELGKEKGRKEPASGLLISACQDDQVAADGRVNGKFTETLLKVWADGSFNGGYRDFHRDILRRMPRDQSPNLYVAGQPAEGFLDQRPFTV